MTQSQKEIISQMLAAGEKTAKIAEVLGISPNTIKSYLRRKKTGWLSELRKTFDTAAP